MKRPHPWQLAKQRTAKALRELPRCSYGECKNRGLGFFFVESQIGPRPTLMSLWLCPAHAQEAQRAQRES